MWTAKRCKAFFNTNLYSTYLEDEYDLLVKLLNEKKKQEDVAIYLGMSPRGLTYLLQQHNLIKKKTA